MDKIERCHLQLSISRELGYDFDNNAVILDLGCGNGELVKAYRQNGYRAFGADLEFGKGVDLSLQENGIIKLISPDYHLPFENNTFHLVVSDQVFEHVKDFPSTLREIKRVLRKGGMGLHIFPARYRLIEPHSHVPLASIIQQYWWLRVWSGLGVRNKYQKGLCAREAARRNCIYLQSRTNYLTKTELTRILGEYFCKIKFCESVFLKCHKPLIHKLSYVFPALPLLYSTFHSRVVFFHNA